MSFLLALFRCSHPRLSRVFTLEGCTYQVCLECGTELEYDLPRMQLSGATIDHIYPQLDEVHERRNAQQ